MEGPFSKTIIERLPSGIRALDRTCQQVFVCLRLRRSPYDIGKRLNIEQDAVADKISEVKHAMTRDGLLHLIEDPQIEPIHSDDPDEPDLPVFSREMDVENRLIIKEFIALLQKAVSELPTDHRRLLKLRYKYRMSAKDILGFCNKVGYSIIPEKDQRVLGEQDIYYALNTALKEVLRGIKTSYSEEYTLGLDNLKYIFEELEI